MAHPIAFTHAKRECAWCSRRFTPTPTLSLHSTEYLCSARCAIERYVARMQTQDPATYEAKRLTAQRCILAEEGGG